MDNAKKRSSPNIEKENLQASGPACKKQKGAFPSFKNADVQVTFLIGKEESTFLVHKEFACYASPVFAAAFNNEKIEEGRTQTYRLQDTTPRAFRLLVQWMYQGKLTLRMDNDEQCEEPRNDLKDAESENLALAELWVLADKLLIPALQNLSIKAIYRGESRTGVSQIRTLKYVYESATTSSHLRRYFVERTAYSMTVAAFRKYAEWFPKEMVVDIAAFAMECMAKGKLGISILKLDLAPYMVSEN